MYAHARFRVDAASARAMAGVVGIFEAGDVPTATGATAIPPVIAHPALRACQHPLLARDTVRYVGEPIAAVVARDRYAAEDGVAAVRIQYDPLPVVADARLAVAPGAPVLHDHLGDNLAAEFTERVGDADAAFRAAEVVVRGRYDVQRYSGVPLETRGVVAAYDPGTGDLTVWSSTQWPHTVRDVLRDVLGLDEHRVRVVAPDVGGGFGVKQEIYPEELVLPLLAIRLARPVKWVETRREHLTTAAHAREQWHDIELAARRDGTLLGMRADILADMGAYSRSLGVLCPSITAASLPGPYRLRHYTCRVRAALTCKAPAAAYRGAGQPEAVFATERALDHLAQDLGMDPAELRRRNFIRRDEFPWNVGTGSAQVPVIHDSGDHEGALDAALDLARYAERRREQAAERAKGTQGRLLGIGVAASVSLTGLGPHEGATLRVDATGKAQLITGASPHGQGTATALAQIVADELGLTPDDVAIRHGDTAMIPFGVGTYASRNAVVAGSAALVAAQAVADKARRLAAHLLEVDPADLELAAGAVRVRAPRIASSRWASSRAAAPGQPLPAGMDPGLESTHYFAAPRPTFAGGVHVAVVEIERRDGADRHRRLRHRERLGPAHQSAHRRGADRRRRGSGRGRRALRRAGVRRGRPAPGAVAPRLRDADRRAGPGDADRPSRDASALNPLGVKGVGEAGALAPPAAIAAAVEDALRPFGARITRTPLRPEEVLRLTGGLPPVPREDGGEPTPAP